MHFNRKFLALLFTYTLPALASVQYQVLPGKLHKKGEVRITVLPDPETYKVEMVYKVQAKNLVPIPSKLLNGQTSMEFPVAFKTEEGYKELERAGSMEIPKAIIKFVKRADFGDLKDAYFLEVFPTNKKSKIHIIYHPSLPEVAWQKVKITFLSDIPVLNGYELLAEMRK